MPTTVVKSPVANHGRTQHPLRTELGEELLLPGLGRRGGTDTPPQVRCRGCGCRCERYTLAIRRIAGLLGAPTR